MNTSDIVKVVRDTLSLQNTHSKLQQTLVDSLVDKELHTRSELLMASFKKIGDMKKDMKKIKPDVVFYTENGEKSVEQYSEQMNKQRKELTEKINKLEKAWGLAFNENNFEELKKVMSEKC